MASAYGNLGRKDGSQKWDCAAYFRERARAHARASIIGMQDGIKGGAHSGGVFSCRFKPNLPVRHELDTPAIKILVFRRTAAVADLYCPLARSRRQQRLT